MRRCHPLGAHLLQVDKREQVRLLPADLVLDLARRHLQQLATNGGLMGHLLLILVDITASFITIYPQFDMLVSSFHGGDLGDRLGVRLGPITATPGRRCHHLIG